MLTKAAMANLEESGSDFKRDIRQFRESSARIGHEAAKAAFLAELLDGADPDREQGWRDYADTVAVEASC